MCLSSLRVVNSTRSITPVLRMGPNRALVLQGRRTWNEKNNEIPHRRYHTGTTTNDDSWKVIAGIIGATTFVTMITVSSSGAEAESDAKINYDAIRKDIVAILDKPGHDDGSYGPILIRLAWHAAGTYDKATNTGGSNGSTMRFAPESKHEANAGLALARELLEPIKKKHPAISYADLWSLAGAVAVEELGGPPIKWRPGRSDHSDSSLCSPNGRLPDASKGAPHIRDIFGRMGFTDREIVALVGAHAVGRCHPQSSGFTGPWTPSPTVFSNDFFEQLLKNKWTKKKWSGPEQFEDPSGKLMMLPADLALLNDPEFRKYVEIYAEDQDVFFKDFAAAFQKLEELGVPFPEQKSWWKFW